MQEFYTVVCIGVCSWCNTVAVDNLSADIDAQLHLVVCGQERFKRESNL